MNERIKNLRSQSLEMEPVLSTERAELITKFYKENQQNLSTPVKRALSFKYLLENKTICINDHELIVGERGPKPKATPTYPELCCHSLQDLDILNSREKISFAVSPESRELYSNEIIPFWKGKTMREMLFENMSEEWINAYEAGIFTEFMEQRAPGHTVLDDKIYKKGFRDFKNEIETEIAQLDFYDDPNAYYKHEELKAMSICCDAIIIFGKRHATKALEIAKSTNDPERKKELEKIAEICNHVPENTPRNFHEALQMYWFVHLGVITELNTWDSFNPGRLDQNLYPFFKNDIIEGKLTKEEAKELLECFWIKFNSQPAPPKVGVTAAESGTYTDFANINVGGMKPDGTDGINELSYLLLDVIDEMRLLQPSSNIQLSKKNPDRFLKRACEIIRKGWGQPSIFNADLVVEELIRQGKAIEDARKGGTSGCVETGAFGKESYILTGYFNPVKVLEITLYNGIDTRTGKKIGLETGDPEKFISYEEFLNAFKRQLKYFVDIKIKGNNIIERLYAEYMPSPFLSVIVDDCIKNGKDYNNGGARYKTTYIMSTAPGTLTDSFSAIKYHIYDKKHITMEKLLAALKNDFSGSEDIRQLLWNKTPKYGNDDEYADEILVDMFNTFYDMVNGRKNTKGGSYHVNYLSTTCHVYFGSVTGASPDGRKAWEPLSDGISPVHGADKYGPTAVIKSAAKMDHAKTGGTLLNQKFTPQLLEGDEGINKIASLVRSYFKLDGHHIQFNVVNSETLKDAQLHPEKHRDLIVRVAGYSDYFCDLTIALQNEIIARTEQKKF